MTDCRGEEKLNQYSSWGSTLLHPVIKYFIDFLNYNIAALVGGVLFLTIHAVLYFEIPLHCLI